MSSYKKLSIVMATSIATVSIAPNILTNEFVSSAEDTDRQLSLPEYTTYKEDYSSGSAFGEFKWPTDSITKKDYTWIKGVPSEKDISNFCGNFNPTPQKMAVPFVASMSISSNGKTVEDSKTPLEIKKNDSISVTGKVDTKFIGDTLLNMAKDMSLDINSIYLDQKSATFGAIQSFFVARITVPEEFTVPGSGNNTILKEGTDYSSTMTSDLFTIKKVIREDDQNIAVYYRLKNPKSITNLKILYDKIVGYKDGLNITVNGIKPNDKAKYNTVYDIKGKIGGIMNAAATMNPQDPYIENPKDDIDIFTIYVGSGSLHNSSISTRRQAPSPTNRLSSEDLSNPKYISGNGFGVDMALYRISPVADSATVDKIPEENKVQDMVQKVKILPSGSNIYVGGDDNNTGGDGGNNPDDGRISGNDRIETSVEVSKNTFDKAPAVILANKDKFSDVLTAVPFSVQIGAPILFTNTDSLPQITQDEIARLGAKKVYINGGTESVSQKIEDDLKKSGKDITRFNGFDRYETARLIGEKIREKGNLDVVEIASGQTFPDALSISSLAVKENAPILISKKDDLTDYTKNALAKWDIKKATIAGQTQTISNSVEKTVKNGFNIDKKSVKDSDGVFKGATDVRRIGGADRYETSVLIAKYTLPKSELGVYASGQLFADSLVAGPYAAINKAPVLLVKKNSVPKSVEDYTRSSDIKKLTLVGGMNTVTDSTFNMLKKLLSK